MVTAIATSLAGFYMIWVRKAVSTNLAGDITKHRRWALRLFMVVNAVWFLRIGYRLFIVTIFMGIAIYAATVEVWLPNVLRVIS
jgi:type IV secretory pathway TrbL component